MILNHYRGAGKFLRSGLPNVTDGLVSWWKFDEGSGSTAADSAGSNDGTLVGNPDWVAGKINGALVFYGSGDCVEITEDSGLTFFDEVTISAWINLASPLKLGYVFARNVDGSGTPELAMLIRTDTGARAFAFYLSTQLSDLGPSGFNWSNYIDEWAHVAMTWDGTTIRAYINAEDTGVTGSYTVSVDTTIGNNIRIGARHDAAFFRGKIDDVRIYNRGLSAEEITTLYNWRP